MSPLVITLIVFALTVACFFSGKFSLGLIGLTASLALQLTGVLSSAAVWANFTNASVVMFGSLFVLSAGLMKTSIVDKFVEKLSTVKGNQRVVLWSCLTVSIILACLMNATAAMSTMIPLIMVISERSEVNPRKILKPCCDVANTWAGALPIGVGASGYLTTNLLIQQLGGTVEMGILDSALMKLPPLILATAIYYFFSHKLTPNEPLVVTGDAVENSASVRTKESQLTPTKEKLTYTIFFGTIVGMLLSGMLRWTNLPTFIFPVLGSIIMVFCGILTPKEATSNVPLGMMLLVGGMMNVAGALGSTGGAELIGNALSSMLGGTSNIYILTAVLFVVPFIATQFMNNIPVANAFQPLAIATCLTVGADPRIGAMAVSFAAGASVLTPMAAVVQAMIMGPGQYKFLDYVKCGLLPMLVYMGALIVWMPFLAGVIW